MFFNMEGEKENQLEVLKTDVWTKLPQLNLEELEQVCTALDLPIEPSKQGRRSAVYSIVTLHLMSNEVNNMDVDMSLEMFGNVQGALDGILTVRTMKTEVGQMRWLVLVRVRRAHQVIKVPTQVWDPRLQVQLLIMQHHHQIQHQHMQHLTH